METKKKKKGYCARCGRKLKKIDTGIRQPTEPYRPDEPYDGDYKTIFFSFCKKCDKK